MKLYKDNLGESGRGTVTKIPHLMSFPETWTLVGVAVAVEDMITADRLVHPRTLDHPGKTEMVSGHQHAQYEERKEETMRWRRTLP